MSANPPHASVEHTHAAASPSLLSSHFKTTTAAPTIANDGALHAVPFGTASGADGIGWAISSGLFTVPTGKGGRFLIVYEMWAIASTTGMQWLLQINKNSGTKPGESGTGSFMPVSSTANSFWTRTHIIDLADGDTFQIEAAGLGGGGTFNFNSGSASLDIVKLS